MTSKQLNFFHTDADVLLFIDFFKDNNYELLPYKVKDLEEVDNINLLNQNRIEIFSNRRKIHFDFIEKQGYYLFNADKSEAIEFLLCYKKSDEGRIEAGRLYYTEKYYTADGFIPKDSLFVDDSKRLFRLFKKQFLKKTDYSHSWYFTQSLIDLFKDGKAAWGPNPNLIDIYSQP